jgi:hypothetical protein
VWLEGLCQLKNVIISSNYATACSRNVGVAPRILYLGARWKRMAALRAVIELGKR